MKRLFIILISLLAMMTASHSVKAQQVTIDLLPGWNYIAYPYPTTVELNTFLSSITPMNGDIIKSFYASSLYLNGRWRGAITILEPGVGYHYFSNNPNIVTLVWDNPIIPDENVAVTTSEPTDVNVNSATCGGIVASNDGSYVAIDIRGICWSTHPHPTFNDNYVEAGNVMGSFTVSLTELNPGVTYYVRAFAVTSQGTFFGNEVSFTTLHTVTISVNPMEGGAVSGAGNYEQGQSCTLTATANEGYTFTNWTENDEVVSTEATYTFTVTGDRTLVANFTLNTYAITAVANPTAGGTVTGAATYEHFAEATLTATANEGYHFVNWTEGGTEVVSTNATYTFTVTGDRTLVANFINGAINGLFSVSASQQVYFSRGNLQYQASTDTWKFAENQWDMIGSENSNISENYVGWIDLFGWGTSGYHDSNDPYNVNYQPWSTSTSEVNSSYNKYGYGPSTNMTDPNLTGTSANYDWGVYNPISNGGNTTNQWRTLTNAEWIYVFNTRSTTSGIRYAKANVNNVNGVILLPDDWSNDTYILIYPNNSGASFSRNTITASQWNILERAGAVFLPAAGYRYGTDVYDVGSRGDYWSASYGDSGFAFCVDFYDGRLLPDYWGSRLFGFSVRLVCPAEN